MDKLEHEDQNPEVETTATSTETATPSEADAIEEVVSSEVETVEVETPTEDTPTSSGPTPSAEQKAVNFTETLDTTKPLTEDVNASELLGIIRESYSTVQRVVEQSNAILKRFDDRENEVRTKLRNQGKPVTDEDGSLWYRTLLASLPHSQTNELGEVALTRGEWLQSLEYEGKQLRPGQPRQRLSGKHSAEERLTYLSRKAGVGTVFDVPLYSSGVWLRFKTPPLSALTGLQYQLNQLKVTLGSESKGYAFSNTAQSLTSAAVDFALNYVIDSNIHFNTPSDLKDHIKTLDIPSLLWGLAVTLYPKGFPYVHPCIADISKCNYLVKETLNLNRLFWTDTLSLTKTQRKLMSTRFDVKLSEEEQRLYQAEHVRGNKRLVWFGDLGLMLKVPTIFEFEEAGRSWIDGIVTMTQGAFNEPPHGNNRDNYITRLGLATMAREYAHWVDGIYERDEDGNEEIVADDEETVNEILDHIFSTDDYVEDFFKRVTEYIEDSTISMIAVPSFNCPQCKSPISEKFHERFDHLVPIDTLTTFFTLVNQKQG